LEVKGGVDLTQPEERARVDKLKEQILSDEGYVARVIVDADNNVVEGQHRASGR
jgi:disulfide oxidoreductase YuzD